MSFSDAEGRMWRAREVQAGHIPGSRGDYCLVLETDEAFSTALRCRRIWKYSAKWYELSSKELLALNPRA